MKGRLDYRRLPTFPMLVWIYALCLASAGDIRAQNVYQDNVVIVLDGSGSMGNRMSGGVRKIDAAKDALKEVLKNVPPSTNVGLLVFSAKRVPNDWLYPLGPRDDAQLLRVIDLPEPGLNTPLGEYIKRGADRLLQAREEQRGYGSYKLLIVTDGEATDGNLTDVYVPQVLARGITIDVIGVDMKKDHTLATKVNSYRRANDPAGLKQAIADVFGEVGGVGDDTTSAEAFELIAPLPADVAAAAIEAFAQPNNKPIGTTDIRAVDTGRGPSGPAPRSQPVGQPSSPQRSMPRSGPGMPFLFVGFVFLVVVIKVLKKAGLSGRR